MDIEQVFGTYVPIRTPALSVAAYERAAKPSAGVLIEHSLSSDRRAEVEEFIHREFLMHFGASVTKFMPRLIALHEPHGEVRAVVGVRGAATERLFLETYTRNPIEQVIAEQLGCAVAREQIVEVGSLACRSGRAAMEIVKAVIPSLIGAGFTWVVFTGADTVRNVFRRLDLRPHPLCSADKTLLGDEQYEWGSYYDYNPIVMAGRLVDGIHAVDTIPGMQ
jgi:hypothetical protein